MTTLTQSPATDVTRLEQLAQEAQYLCDYLRLAADESRNDAILYSSYINIVVFPKAARRMWRRLNALKAIADRPVW